ncbi:MAG: hypothetical protein IJ836_05845 [Spirochaetales bacterium]|nr:hypothetical protein [Spirochaetales bacterium]
MYNKKAYTECSLEVISITPDVLVSGSINDELEKRIRKIIKEESPIQKPLLLKRLINSLSLYKVGSEMEKFFSSYLPTLNLDETTENGITVYHDPSESLDSYRFSDSSLRYSYQIPLCEAALVIAELLSRTESTYNKKYLLDLFSKELEYQKKGSQVVALFEASLAYAVSNNMVTMTKNYRYKTNKI